MTATRILSERRAADRTEMAKGVMALVAACGATATQACGADYLGPHTVGISITTPRGLCLTVDFEGDSWQPDVYVMSWHMAFDAVDTLEDATFGGSVNPHHFRKATYVAYGYEDLCKQLKKGLDLAISGKAFRPLKAAPVPAFAG